MRKVVVVVELRSEIDDIKYPAIISTVHSNTRAFFGTSGLTREIQNSWQPLGPMKVTPSTISVSYISHTNRMTKSAVQRHERVIVPETLHSIEILIDLVFRRQYRAC